MYRSDIDQPLEWERVDPLHQRVARILKDFFYRAFLRDVRVNKVQVAKILLRSLILIAFLIFWVNALYEVTPAGYIFGNTMQWIIAVTGGAMILFTGMISDTLSEKHGIFEKVSITAIAPMFFLLAVNNDIVAILAMFAFTVMVAFLIVFFVVGLIITTTMLNRARVIVLMITIMATFAAPIASFLVITQTFIFIWIFAITVAVISLAITIKHPRRYTPTFTPIKRLPGLRGFLRVIRESHAFRTATFLFCTAFSLSYHAVSAIYAMQDAGEWVLLGIVVVGSLPVIAGVIDNRGRKPLVYIMLLLLGIFATFYDQPGFDITPVRYLKVGVLGFSVILLIILTVVFAGDLSSSISRGRITSVLLFCVILGTIVGVMAGNYNDSWVRDYGAEDPLYMTTISNLTALSTFVAMFMFITTKEQLQAGTTRWRDYLIRLHVIMNNGLSLVFKEFRKRKQTEETDTLEDLESGGLTGLQQMLQEIASSRQRIRVLDHGDVYLIFHYGTFTTAVLFVEKNLVIYREMLANFHLQLEYINKDVIKENYINQEELVHIDWLIGNYFS
jgi:hypothetical protein